MLTTIDSISPTDTSLIGRVLNGLRIIQGRYGSRNPVKSDVICPDPNCGSFKVVYTGFCKSKGNVIDDYHCLDCHGDFSI